ncbi:MAG: hypothetical protein PHG04_03345 [Candidatus Nanoarchaeia archaeon]|nr:hypothetical protein [Candidatus Nanoarchaeia archaeon]MDD5054386.1 hypothetical protein [Candidatus Nanoarchaeia archaeon]
MKGFAIKLKEMDSDLEIFLSKEEINDLENHSIKGALYDVDNMRIEYEAELILDTSKMQKESNNRIGLPAKEYKIYISKDYYERLKTIGHVGTRVCSPLGDLKVDILEEKKAKELEDFAGAIRRIAFHEEMISKGKFLIIQANK